MIYYLKHNIHKLNWTIIGNVLGMVLIAQACLMVLPVMADYHSTCRVKFLLLWIASLKRCLDLQRQVQVF